MCDVTLSRPRQRAKICVWVCCLRTWLYLWRVPFFCTHETSVMRKRNAPQQMPPLRVGRTCLLAAQSDVCLSCATDTRQIPHIYERQLEGVQLKSYVLTGRGPVTLIESFSRACYVRNYKEWHCTMRDSTTQTEGTVGNRIHPLKQLSFLQARLWWMFTDDSGNVKYVKYAELGSVVSPNSSVSVVTRLCDYFFSYG